MEVDQITSLVSIFSFGQQLFKNSEAMAAVAAAAAASSSQPSPTNSPVKDSASSAGPLSATATTTADDDSDSDSDTSSDSGHSSDDNEKNSEDNSTKEGCCGDGGVEVVVVPELSHSCAQEMAAVGSGCDGAAEAVGGLGVAAAV